jgi:hypothetical protein
MCLILHSCTGLDAIKMAPWLSLQSGIGMELSPSLLKSILTHTNCLLASESDIYSASVEDSTTVFCALEFQLNTVEAIFMMYPVVDQWLTESEAQSEST